MEIVSLLRTLWRRRYLAAIGLAVALALAGLTMSRPAASSGVATTRVSLDTPESQLVTDAPKGLESLPWRATMFASLLGTDAARARIVQEMGIGQDQLNVVDQELTFPQVPASLPKTAALAGNAGAEPYVLTTHTDDVLPLIEITAAAPDRGSAARLADAAVHSLETDVSPLDTASLQGLDVERVGPIEAKTVEGASGKKTAFIMALALIVFWWGALVLIPTIRAAWRNVAGQAPAVG
jgi:hypothetical protein